MKAIISNISGWSWVNISPHNNDKMEGEFSDFIQLETICSSITLNDLKALRGESSNIKPGIIIGHEAVAKINYIPSKLKEKAKFKGLNEGDRVVFYPFHPCNECNNCQSENFMECLSPKRMGFDVDGVFSHYILAPLSVLFKVPSTVDDSHALYLESVATALASCENERIVKCREIAIVGQGEVASLLTKIIDHRLSAINNFLSIKLISPSSIGSYPNRFDGVIEAWSDPTVSEGMIKALKPGGTLLLKKRPDRKRLWAESKAREKYIYVEHSSFQNYEKALNWMAEESVFLSSFYSAGFEFSSSGLQGIFDINSSHENLGKIYFDFSK